MRTSTFATVSMALAIALSAGAVFAQDGKTAAAPVAASAASMPSECGSGMKRHDHGAERNAPSSKAMPCAPENAASGAKAKAKPPHDTCKVHKNQ